MKNKILLLIVTLFCSITYGQVVGDEFKLGALYFEVTSVAPNEVKVTSELLGSPAWNDANKPTGIISVPNQVSNGSTTYSVTSIGYKAFKECSGLTSVSIPNSVTSIEYEAFKECSGLTSVSIPNSVTSIGGDSFSGCSSLTSVSIPNSVTGIGSAAFSGCEGLTSVSIPNSVTSIGSAAFSGCEGLTSINIPNSVTSIEESTFSGCEGLTSFNIPNSVTSIGQHTFSGCGSLTSVSIPNSVTSIGSFAFYRTNLTSVNIPNSVTSIEDHTFSRCYDLTSITIPNSVTSIGDNAFLRCNSLTSVSVPNSVISIGAIAFQECTALTSVSIPESVTSIGNSAFSKCSSLSLIEVAPSNPSYYSENGILFNKSKTTLIQFPSEYSIANYSVPNSVTSIGDYAFSNYQYNLKSISIPNSVTNIGEGAFSECTNLTSINVDPSNPSYFSEDGVLFNKSKTTLIQFPSNHSISNYSIPNSVISIGDYAFYNCDYLKSISIPNSVTNIGEQSFWECSNLTSVSIPNSVTNIGSFAFNFCENLKYVECKVENPANITIGYAVFYNMDSESILFVPSIGLQDYKTSDGWEDFSFYVSNSSLEIVTNADKCGEIAITASGGIEPYTYSIDGVNFQSSNIFTNLTSGSYNIIVKDSGEVVSGNDTQKIGFLSDLFIKGFDTFTLPTIATYGDEPLTLITRSGLPVILTSSDTTIAVINDSNNVVIKGAGTVIITATQAGNDSYCSVSKEISLTIKKKVLEVSGITVSSKEYDGNTAATIDMSNVLLEGLLTGDSVTVNVTGEFFDRNVGTDKSVDLTITYVGVDKDNYRINDQDSTTADITKAEIKGISFEDRIFVYDGAEKSISVSGDVSDVSVVYEANTSTALGTTIVKAFITGSNYKDLVLTANLIIRKIAGDSDGDGEITSTEIAGDLNEDGEISGTEKEGDTNGDGNISGIELGGDTNNNGVIDGNEIEQEIKATIRHKFQDVLIFNNKNKEFTAWEWYRNGVVIPEAIEQVYYSKTKLIGNYFAIGISTSGERVRSNTLVVDGTAKFELIFKVYPNPLTVGQNATVVTTVSEELLKGSKLVVYDVLGTMKRSEQEMTSQKMELGNLPTTPGLYVVQLSLKSGLNLVFNIIIK